MNADRLPSCRSSSACRPVSLAFGFAVHAALGTDIAICLEVHSGDQTPVAAPPVIGYGECCSTLPPFLVGLVSPAKEIFLVEVSQMITEVILSEEGELMAGTPFVVT